MSFDAARPAVTFASDGSAEIVALHVPIPTTISGEAQAMLRRNATAGDPTNGLSTSVEEIRAFAGARQEAATAYLLSHYEVTVERKTLSGVAIAHVVPRKRAPGSEACLLVNLHGGAFFLGARSIVEAIPIAALTGIPVVAIDYRLAPEHPFPAAVDDTVNVWRALLETHAARHMALYGSSAGAVLSAQASVRMQQLGLDLPAALGFFSGTVDFARAADSEALFSLPGLAAVVAPVAVQAKGYLADNDLTDPVMSPAYADMSGFPPTLLLTGTRDFFLSGTANFHRALLRAGVAAELVVFDAMPHVHWQDPCLPETREALQLQADFLARHVA